MKTITIHLEVPHGIALLDVYAALRAIGIEIRLRNDGAICALPAKDERHGNSCVIRFPHRKRQFNAARLESPPEVA